MRFLLLILAGALSANAASGPSISGTGGSTIVNGVTNNYTPNLLLRGSLIVSNSDGLFLITGRDVFSKNSAGTTIWRVDTTNSYVKISQRYLYAWSSSLFNGDAASDTAIGRNAAGVVEANNGTLGVLATFKGAFITATNTMLAINGYLIDSNGWVNVAATVSGLSEGQGVLLSSNGVPHIIWKVGGVLTTNSLVPAATASTFPLTNTTVVLTNNGYGGQSRAISFERMWNSTSNLAINFHFNSTKNSLYMDDNGVTHFNTFGAGNFTVDQGLTITDLAGSGDRPVIATSTGGLGIGASTSTVTQNLAQVAFNNNGTAVTNINGQNLKWPTNVATTATINMGLSWSAISTNNNFVFSGYTGLDASGTNVQAITMVITNTAGSASVKTIAMPSGSIDLLNTGLTLYNTNQGVLTVAIYPGMGTNFSWIGK